MASNDNADAWMEDMTLIQLKDELRRRKMKTGVKADLIRRLQIAIMYEKEKDDSDSDDEEARGKTNNEHQDARHNRRVDETDNRRMDNQQEAYYKRLTFKDVKDSMGI